MLSSANKKSIICPRKKHTRNMQMAGFKGRKIHSKKMTNDIYRCCLFVITILEVTGETHMSVHDSNHVAFIQANNNDVRFMGVHEGLQVYMHEEVASTNMRVSKVNENSDEDAFSTSTYLKFVPPRLDFKERFLGVPHLEKVILINTDENKTIHMSSVSGTTLHFHSSFFQDKTIPPKGNTTFAVVFLGRVEGQVSTNLYIHTSEGIFKYQVSGASICSPYRLRPLGGVRLPLNAAFQPLIQLHNPHHYPIQVVEVYSSGREFYLELPEGEAEGSKTLWEVPPYTTKPVIRAKFEANAQSNHTAYIRLKLNNSEEVLVVPLEVEVTSQPGLYSHQPIIDFGIGGSQDEPKKISLYLCSSLKKSLKINSVSTVPATSSLKVNFEATKIPPGTTPVEVAELIFDWKQAFATRETSGKILIKSKQNQYKLSIPFTARVLEGGLKVNEKSTRFLTSENRFLPRHLAVENQFDVSVAVNNVSLLPEADIFFQIKNFRPMVIPPKKSVTLLTLFLKENNIKNLRLESGMILFTNVSDVKIPLFIYSGKLTKIFPRGFEDKEFLDFGLIGCAHTKTLRFGLQNNNPVEIEIKSVESNSQFVVPQILGIYSKNTSEFLNQYNFEGLTKSTKIKPNDIVVVQVLIEASEVEEIMTAEVTVFSLHENLSIPVKAVIAHGALEIIPNQIVLDDCFPGKVCIQPLKILSTFSKAMTATSVSSVPFDSRLSFAPAAGGTEILPGTSSYIGDLKWEPGKHCGSHCYVGVTQNTSESLFWMPSEILSTSTTEMDAVLLRDRYHRLLNITDGFGSGYWQNIILRLDTNGVREELFKAKVRLIWPKFSSTNRLVFPLTQVSNTTVQKLKLFNSASHTVVLQLVMEWAYPQAKRLIDSFPSRSNLKGNCFDSSPIVFNFFKNLSTSSDRGKLNVTLMPGESFEVSISYTPNGPQKSCSLLFIRNNLTIIEVVEIHGQASYAQLKFGNRKPGSENPLMFEIAEKHLRDCHKEKKDKKSANPNLTVKRSFTVRNVGELSVYIHNFYINGLECEGYGYSVLNCDSFELPINGTKKIDVAFTPDFTLSKIQRMLTIDTSLGIDVNYTLVTTLPPLFLSACSSVLGRPSWEPLLYYSAVSFMVFLLFCVLAAAFFESDRILKCALMTLTRDRTTSPLDLRQIGSTVSKEFIHTSGKKVENNLDHFEKAKLKEMLSSGNGFNPWSHNLTSDGKHYGFVPKDEKFDECGTKNDSLTPAKEKEVGIATISNFVQLSNITKHKKKFTKKHSCNSDLSSDQSHEILSHKKKDKTVANSGWCSVFSRGNAEKTKTKMHGLENGNVKNVRYDAEVKKDENKKDEKRGGRNKKIVIKEITKEEEETSSTTTESSNDTEKENIETTVTAAMTRTTMTVSAKAKNEKSKKIVNKEKKSVQGCELKENALIWDYNEEEVEKEKKCPVKTSSKIHLKNNKLNNTVEVAEINSWKSNGSDTAKQVDYQKQKINKNVREKKEKAASKKKFSEKAVNTKSPEPSSVHRSSLCWEHRSFSEVVAKNDNSTRFTNAVAAKNEQQKHLVPSEPVFSEPEKVPESTTSSLGPIGSKKPQSHWSPLSYSCPENQNSLFGSSFADLSVNKYLHPPSSNLNFSEEKSLPTEKPLPTDRKNLWEDQNSVMQLLHHQDSDYQLSWKENWLDYLWCSNRNMQRPEENLSSDNSYESGNGASWGSLLRSSWTSPTPWSPSASRGTRPVESDGVCHNFNSYDSLSESKNFLDSQDSQNGCLDLASTTEQSSDPLNQVLFASSGGSLFRSRSKENLTGNGFQFDPYHSLNSIWSPKTQNTWNSPGN